MYDRAWNFNAGPAVLPVEVVETVRDNLVNYQNCGIGIMEMSHRSKQFDPIIKGAEADLRELLNIGEDYSIVFLGGGATLQFSMAPMNLLQAGQEANYIISGVWAKKAAAEARKVGTVHVAATSEDRNYCYIPQNLTLSNNPAYLHFTSNNTIFGTQFREEPMAAGAPLICDASSDFLHKKIDITRYGLIYAGAQKNLGPAGVTVVIVRKDLLTRSPGTLPIYLNYNTHAEGQSLFNTPPVVPIYAMSEVFKWLKRQGGLAAMEERNRRKAAVLYDAIDSSDLYTGTADRDSRSLMNVTFLLKEQQLEARFLEEAAKNKFVGLKGHRSVGGLRASIYNAFPEEGIGELVEFMADFEARQA